MRRTSKDEAQMISVMRSTPGWKIVESCIQAEINTKTAELINCDSMNLRDYGVIQGEIRALNGLLSWIKERDNQVLKD